MTVAVILAALRHLRLPLTSEARLQAAIAEAWAAAGVPYEREVRLSAADRIDFMCGHVGVEVKIKGAKLEIFRQLERYAAHARVGEIVLVTNVPMGLPAVIGEKPAHLFNLARAWL